MTRGITRWLAAPMLLLALTACTSLTDANGSTPTPVPTSTPSQLSEWEKEQLGISGEELLPEELPVYLTKETLPDPQSLVPPDALGSVSASDTEATRTQRILRLPKPIKGGMVSVDIVCVDGTIDLESDSIGAAGINCDGAREGYSFAFDQEFQEFKMTVSRGTSYSIAVYESPYVVSIVD